MKKFICFLLPLSMCLLLFSACSSSSSTYVIYDELDKSIGDISESSSKKVSDGWVLHTDDSSLLIASGNNLFWISHTDVPVKNADGISIESDEIKASDLIKITYNGGIMETYPAVYSGISEITITGSRETLVCFYLSLIEDLLSSNNELFSQTDKITIDVSELTNLDNTEKEALAYLIDHKYGNKVSVLGSDFISDNNTLTEGSVPQSETRITISVTDNMKIGFYFTVNIQNETYEIASVNNYSARKTDGSWTYQAIQ